MAGIMTVELKSLRFFAHHGLHPEEALTGNEFEVDVAVSFEAPVQPITDINNTVNYAEVYRIVAAQMKNTRQLLETIAMEICAQLPQVFGKIKEATVSIRKMNPPITNFSGVVGVCYRHQY